MKTAFSGLFVFAVLTASAFDAFEDSVLKVLNRSPENEQPGLFNIIAQHYRRADLKKSADYCIKARDLARKLGLPDEEGLAHSTLSFIEFQKGNYAATDSLCGLVIDLASNTQNKKLFGAAYNMMGLVKHNEGRFDISLTFFLKALEYRKEANDIPGVASTLNNMGEVYRLFHKHKAALECFRKAEKINRELNNQQALASNYSNMGGVYLQMKDYGSAIYFFNKAIYISETIKDKRALAVALNNLGSVYIESKQENIALPFLLRSLQLSEEIGDPSSVITNLTNLGLVYDKLDSSAKAEHFFKAALESSKQLNSILQTQVVANAYSLFLYNKKRYDSAYVWCRKAFDLRDSIFSSESSQRMIELQTEIEREKQRNELMLKEIDNRRQKQWFLVGGGFFLIIVGFGIYRYRAKQSANKSLEAQNRVIAIKNKEISDSLDYAHKIQTAILPLTSDLARVFPSGLGIYKPKDIVSGDFYWFAELGNYFFVAVGDCTGHGVPGAFMSLLGTDKLTHAVREQQISDPGKILEYLNKSIKRTLRQTATDGLRDGMDIGLCRYDFEKKVLTFAGANRPLYHIRGGSLTELKPTKAAIGGLTTEEQAYNEVHVQFIRDDSFFLFTDGFPDQFGGPGSNAGGKKFTTRRFKDLLIRISEQHMAEQDKALHRELEAWMNFDGIKYDQTDDILVIGLRV